MTDNIPEPNRSKLVSRLADVLPTVPIVARSFLLQDGEKVLRGLDEPSGKGALPSGFRQKLREMLDDHPIAEFCADRVEELIKDNQHSLFTDVNALKTLLPDVDFNELALEIVDALANLPRRYTLVCPLPRPLQDLLGPGESQLQFAAGICLERVSTDFWERFPGTEPPSLGQLGGLLGLGGARRLFSGDIALVMDVDGFISRRRPSRTWVDAVLRFKAFLGLCIARRIVARSYSPDGPQTVLLHGYGPGRDLVVSRSLEPDSDRFLRELILGSRPQASREQDLREIGHILSGEQRLQRIVLASRWLFDCSASSDELMAYIQGVTVLETLLGEPEVAKKGDVSITEVLRSRCAFLLGQSTSERDDLRALIGRIYDVRSRIVHDGQHHLSAPQRELLQDLRLLCGQVLLREAQVAIS